MNRDKVLAAHAAFYQALRRGDLDAIDHIWARGENVCCVHPGGFALFGHAAVLQSWGRILREGPVDIYEENPVVHWMGDHALVICTERVGTHVLTASNGLRLIDGNYLMTHHHAGPTPVDAATDDVSGGMLLQ